MYQEIQKIKPLLFIFNLLFYAQGALSVEEYQPEKITPVEKSSVDKKSEIRPVEERQSQSLPTESSQSSRTKSQRSPDVKIEPQENKNSENTTVRDLPVTPEKTQISEEFTKPTLNLSLEPTTAAWTNALESPLGKNISNCLQQEITSSLPNITGTQKEQKEYVQAYINLTLYEHIKFKVTTLLLEHTQDWAITRKNALEQKIAVDEEYRRLINEYRQKKAALEEKIGASVGTPPSLKQSACHQLFFSLVKQAVRDALLNVF